jgi:very-short-patch-repair endonuclease
MPNNKQTKIAACRALHLRKDLTEAELALWQLLRQRGLGVRFRRQEPIGPYIVDFVCLSRRLVVEADGDDHGGSDHDRRRDAYLCRLGFRVMRFENHEIAWYFEWVIDEIKRALRAQSPTPAAPLQRNGEAGSPVPSPRRGD